ncbi:hypothetical protein DFH06DRAFT_1156598 [Mycena polygramma]|nr:hypothetical protein DFH06DRAFT_1156598 [Mycena polygramma]
MPAPGHIALVAGLVSSSYFTFANIGAAYFGVVPVTARGQTTLSVADRLALWEKFYGIAKVHMAASTVTAGVALSASAYLTSSAPLRSILSAGAAAGFTVAAYTILFMLPLNNKLIATLHANAGKQLEPKDEQRVLDQLDTWRAMHRLRIALGLVSWVASVTALLASDPIIQL